MIVVTVFPLTMNRMKFRLTHNQKQNCHYDHIPFNLKIIRNLYFLSQREIAFESCCITSNLDFNYTFPFELAPNPIQFNLKVIRNIIP